VRALGARYDGKPWLRYVDIGLGTWGEGHDFDDGGLIPLSAVLKHIEIYRGAFRKAQLILSDDAYHTHSRPADQRAVLKRACEERDIGWRDDSILVPWYVREHAGRNCVLAPELFRDAFPRSPTVLEMDHYPTIREEGIWKGRDGSEAGAGILKGAVADLHATYIGHHGDARLWLAENPALTREMINRCGYWLFPTSITLPGSLRRAGRHTVKVTIENRGVAPTYEPYELQLKLTGPGGSSVHVIGAASRSWRPGRPVTVEHDLDRPPGLPPGEYSVRLRLYDAVSPTVRSIDETPESHPAGLKVTRRSTVGRPVELGLKESLRDKDGFYRVATIRVE
jgi:hypothetical protein